MGKRVRVGEGEMKEAVGLWASGTWSRGVPPSISVLSVSKRINHIVFGPLHTLRLSAQIPGKPIISILFDGIDLFVQVQQVDRA